MQRDQKTLENAFVRGQDCSILRAPLRYIIEKAYGYAVATNMYYLGSQKLAPNLVLTFVSQSNGMPIVADWESIAVRAASFPTATAET